MSTAAWTVFFDDPTDPREGVLYDKTKISANDGDVCISFLTYDYLKNISNPYCLDIGADECWWSIFCCEKIPNVRIDAFEPMPIQKEFLDSLRSEYPSIQLHNKAISNKPGFLTFSDQGPSSHSRSETGQKLEAITLDTFLDSVEKVDLIKIDTEGHELQILENLLMYKEKLNAIVFEFSIHWYADELYEAMEKTYSILEQLSTVLPHIYVVSRRGPPRLKKIEGDAIPPFIKHCFETKYQCDLFFTKESFVFETQYKPMTINMA